MKIGKGKSRIITGLPSLANKGDGSQALGPSGIITESAGKIAFTIGAGGTPKDRAALPASARLIGRVLTASHRGKTWKKLNLRSIADLMRFEAKVDRDHQGADSDLTGLLKYRGHYLTTDSGGNDLLRTGGGDPTRVLATFGKRTVANPFPPPPDVPMQSVPTAVASGPGGALFVERAHGLPVPQGRRADLPGRARPRADRLGHRSDQRHRPQVVPRFAVRRADRQQRAALGHGRAGRLARQGQPQLGGDSRRANLQAPYAVAFRSGTAYVTTCSVCKAAGEVRSIPLP